MSVSRRLMWMFVLVVTGAMLATAAFLLLPPWQTRDVAVPPDEATPREVVEAYTDALDAHDCGTAADLMTDDAGSWCEDVAGLGDVWVGRPVRERPIYSGRSSDVEVVRVPVRFDLDWRPLHDDGSMAEGETEWGYLLVRGSPAEPWRIFDQGPV